MVTVVDVDEATTHVPFNCVLFAALKPETMIGPPVTYEVPVVTVSVAEVALVVVALVIV
jgi:hypothetical protein